MQKFTLSILVFIFAWGLLNAQSPFTSKFSSPSGEKRVEVYLSDATLIVNGTNSNTLKVNATGMEPLPERAKGLRPLSQAAADNTGLGLSVTERNNTITITQISSSDLEVSIEMPKNANLLIDHSGRAKKDLKLDKLEGEMELSVNRSNLKITNAVGPVVANSTGGNIEVQFNKLSQQGPTSINTVSGFIDVTLPADAKVNLELTTMSEDVFTDFDIEIVEETERGKRKKNYGCECKEKNIKGTINGGGVEVYLKSIRDNIYLRKE